MCLRILHLLRYDLIDMILTFQILIKFMILETIPLSFSIEGKESEKMIIA